MTKLSYTKLRIHAMHKAPSNKAPTWSALWSATEVPVSVTAAGQLIGLAPLETVGGIAIVAHRRSAPKLAVHVAERYPPSHPASVVWARALCVVWRVMS